MFWPGQRWVCEQICAKPWLFMGPLPRAKAAARVCFDWDMECTAPRGARCDGCSFRAGHILRNVFVHRTRGPISGLMPCQPCLGPSPRSNAAPGCWAAMQLLWDSLSHCKPQQEIVAAAEPGARATSLCWWDLEHLPLWDNLELR